MTLFINSSRAGCKGTSTPSSTVPAAAVWEPSSFLEGTAEQRGVRTLRPLVRTHHRLVPASNSPSQSAPLDGVRRRGKTATTYLLGGLFGLAVVGASVLGIGGEDQSAINEVAPQTAGVVPAR